MSSTQITTWRRYTAAEKKAYRIRQALRATQQECREVYVLGVRRAREHYFADHLGSRVPTMRVNGEML